MSKSAMWRPRKLGEVMAERKITVRRPRRRPERMTVRFGRPVRGPEEPDPWWTPVQIAGCGRDSFQAVAGEDSLQSLLLGLEYATQRLAVELRHVGGKADWLGEPERLIFAREALSKAVEGAVMSLLGRLKMASAILDEGTAASRRARTRAIAALDELGEQTGHWSMRSIRKKRRGLRRTG
jgi:hypothetical protein